jgi:hypothetical protein
MRMRGIVPRVEPQILETQGFGLDLEKFVGSIERAVARAE